MSNLVLTEDQILAIENERNTIFFNSRFSFLRDHLGFRKGRVHLFLGESGGGKSTLFRSMLVDLLKNNTGKRISIWLSEEEVLDVVSDFTQHKILRDALKKGALNIFSEIELENLTIEKLEPILVEKCQNFDIVFLDNITTSLIYQDRPSEVQAKVYRSLKALVKKHKIPMVIFGHTGGSVSNQQFTSQNDIRGSKTANNLTEFIYMVQQLRCDDEKITTIRCVKSRGTSKTEFGYFLNYNEKSMVYDSAALQTPEIFLQFLKASKRVMGVK